MRTQQNQKISAIRKKKKKEGTNPVKQNLKSVHQGNQNEPISKLRETIFEKIDSDSSKSLKPSSLGKKLILVIEIKRKKTVFYFVLVSLVINHQAVFKGKQEYNFSKTQKSNPLKLRTQQNNKIPVFCQKENMKISSNQQHINIFKTHQSKTNHKSKKNQRDAR